MAQDGNGAQPRRALDQLVRRQVFLVCGRRRPALRAAEPRKPVPRQHHAAVEPRVARYCTPAEGLLHLPAHFSTHDPRVWHAGKTIIDMAVRAECKRFVGHPMVHACVQTLWQTGQWTVDLGDAPAPPVIMRDTSETVRSRGVGALRRGTPTGRVSSTLSSTAGDTEASDDPRASVCFVLLAVCARSPLPPTPNSPASVWREHPPAAAAAQMVLVGHAAPQARHVHHCVRVVCRAARCRHHERPARQRAVTGRVVSVRVDDCQRRRRAAAPVPECVARRVGFVRIGFFASLFF